jgi:hypothetical protein
MRKLGKPRWEIDEWELATMVGDAFVEQFGWQQVNRVHATRYPDGEYFVVVEVPQKTEEMRSFCLDIGQSFLEQEGLKVTVICQEAKA